MLSLKYVAINSFNENVVYLHKDCEAYQLEDISGVTRIEVHGGANPLFAFLEVVEDEKIVATNELGLNKQAFESLNLPQGANVRISIAPIPPSLASVRRKMQGSILTGSEYSSIVRDIEDKRYSNIDIASFLTATGSFMAPQEVLFLTEALAGKQRIDWDKESIIADYHSLGGIPGNKTDIIVAAIVAAYGLPMVKTAAKSQTSCAGVADTFAVLAKVEQTPEKIRQIVDDVKAVIVDYASLPACKACRIISDVEKTLKITQQKHVIASILAIKLAAGVTHLVLDIPVGPTARIKSTDEALQIRKTAEYIGDKLGLYVDAVITDGSEPIGNGMGALLEARDVMKVLRNKPDAPQDLLEKSLFMAGRIIEFAPKVRGGQGYAIAKEILASGRALEAINKMIFAQGKAPQVILGHLTSEIVAEKAGVIESIDNQTINKIGNLAGAPQYAGAGIDLLKKVGDRVERGEVLYRIHSISADDFNFVNSLVDGNNGYEIKSRRK